MERIDDLQIDNLKILQDTDGFRFGIDSVLLTEFARDIKSKSKIIDLGTGTGVIGILLSKKVNPSQIVGIELQKEVADMASRSVKMNGLESIIQIVNKDIKEIDLKDKSVDVIVTNPPYKKKETGINSTNERQRISRFETTADLDEWIRISSKLLKPKGSFYMVYRPDRLTELFSILKKYKLETKRMRFIYSKIDAPSKLVLIKAVKNGGEFLKIEKPLIIYNNNGEYTDEILKIYNKKDYGEKNE